MESLPQLSIAVLTLTPFLDGGGLYYFFSSTMVGKTR